MPPATQYVTLRRVGTVGALATAGSLALLVTACYGEFSLGTHINGGAAIYVSRVFGPTACW